jgi:hypothetical protein
MQVAEREQCRVDKFWGLDLQNANCQRECMLMSFEDSASRSYLLYCRTLEKQSTWKEEFSRQQYQAAYDSALREQENRKKYMSLLFTAASSDAIISYRWNNSDDSTLLSILGPPAAGNNNGMSNVDDSFVASSLSSSQVLMLPPPDLGPRNISLHLDGIQQVAAKYSVAFVNL